MRVGKGVSHEGLKSLTYDECIVMMLQLVKSAACLVSCHECADRPLINRTGISVFLEERRGDERFQHKPPSNIHTVMDGYMSRRFREYDEKRDDTGV